jgi:hypothetical protein
MMESTFINEKFAIQLVHGQKSRDTFSSLFSHSVFLEQRFEYIRMIFKALHETHPYFFQR